MRLFLPVLALAAAAALSAPATAQTAKPPPAEPPEKGSAPPGDKAPAAPGQAPMTPQALAAEATRGTDIESCLVGTRLRDARICPVRRAGPAGPVPVRRLVVAVDSSGSMSGRAGGPGSKMDAAKRSVAAFLGGVPADVEVGLVAFGRRGSPKPADKALSCQAGGETLFPVGGDRATTGAAVDALRPSGWTPLAAALEHAATLLQTSETAGERVVWVVSDGVETCGGDPVAAGRALHEGGLKAVVNVIGFDVAPRERAALEAVARAGGGVFLEARNDREVAAALGRARELIDRSRATTAAVTAQYANTRETARRTGEVWACFNRQMTAEQDRFMAIDERARAGGTVSNSDSGAASRLLSARYRALTDRVQAFTDALNANDAAKAAEIEAELRRATGDAPR